MQLMVTLTFLCICVMVLLSSNKDVEKCFQPCKNPVYSPSLIWNSNFSVNKYIQCCFAFHKVAYRMIFKKKEKSNLSVQ